MQERDSIFDKRIVVCCGSGGVGKTTVAAAIALEAARRGKKAIVLTIDPARRLATALGLDSLGNSPKKITTPGAAGSLHAMMLDTKRTFDRLIERYTTNPERRKAILENRLYRDMSNMIAGSQEYMATEKLHELASDSDFDFLVLDTPPTRHALDFLEAPEKMIRLTSNSILEWFLKPGFFAGGFGILQKGADRVLSVFDRLAGLQFLRELAEMLSLLTSLLSGFHSRAADVAKLLKDRQTGFLLIASPSSVSVQDALYFHQKIYESGLFFLGFIVNRVHEKLPDSDEIDLGDLSPGLRGKIRSYLENDRLLALQDRGALNLLKKMGGRKTLCATIPLLPDDVHDLEGLHRMGQLLFDDSR